MFFNASHEPEETKKGAIMIVEPDEYPTDFLQPIFSLAGVPSVGVGTVSSSGR